MFRCCFCIKPVQIKSWGFANVCFLQDPSFRNTVSQPFLTTSAANPPSFTVDYLMNSCGLSLETALSAAEKINLKTPMNPDSVLALLRSHGFNKTQIRDIITRHPRLLKSSVDKILNPKFQFLLDLGFSLSDLPELIVPNPNIITKKSLKNRLIPSIDFLRGFLHTNDNIIKAIKRCHWLLTSNLHKSLVPKVSILQHHGIPNSNISKLILLYPRRLMQKTDKFNEIILRVKELGFDSSSPSMFTQAAMAICSMSKSTWDAKIEVFRSLGWSETEIHSAFKNQPFCMSLSGENIRRRILFFTNELNWEPSKLSSYPQVLIYSLEARIIPRYRVTQILTSRNVVKKKLGMISIFSMSEKKFLEKYITRYQKEVPDILKAYQDRMGSI